MNFCLIFRIITNDANNATKQFVLFNKTFGEWKTSFQNFFSTSSLKKFSQELVKLNDSGNYKSFQSYTNYIKGLSEESRKAAIQIAGLARQYRAGKITLDEYNAGVKNVIVAQKELSITSKLASTGLNLLVQALPVIVISAIVTAIGKYNQKLEEMRQAQDKAADEAKKHTEQITELYEKYKQLSKEVETNESAKDDLKSTTSELLKLLGIEEDKVDDLIGKYGTLGNVIDKVAYSALVESQSDLGTDVENTEKDLAEVLKSKLTGAFSREKYNISEYLNKEVFDIIASMNFDDAIEYVLPFAAGSGDWETKEAKIDFSKMFDLSSIDGVKKLYDTYISIMDAMEKQMGSRAYEDKFFQAIQTRANEIKPALKAYSDALDAYDDNISRQMILSKKMSDGIPETAEAFEIWRKELIDTAKANTSYFDDSDIEGSIDKALGSMAEFSQYMSDFSHTTENVEFTVKPTFDIDESSITESLTTLKENIDDILKNADLFDKAVEAMTKGESISFDDMMKLVGLDPSLANKFTQTADGYKTTLEDLNEARQNYIQDTQDTLSESIKTNNAFAQQIQQNIVDLQAKRAEYAKHVNSQDDVKNLEKYDAQIAYQQQLLERVQQTNAESALYQGELNATYKAGAEAIKTYDEILKDLANKESLLDSVHKELNDDGYISVSTYQKLIEAGEDYADLVTIENGKLKIEEQALKDLIVQKYKDQVATIELAKAEKIRELAVMSSTGATQEEIQKIRDEIAELEVAANRARDIVGILEGYTPTDNGNKGKTKSLYSNELQLLKDDLNDGIITYEQFLQKWQALNDKYHAMSEDDGGISDYEWGQNNRDIIAERTKAYEQEKARLKELYEAGSITLEQYNAQLNTSLNHWLGGYAQLSSEYEKEVKSNTKELYEYRKKEYDDEIKDLKELYEKGEITLEQLDSKMSESANHWLGGIADLSDEFKDAVDDNYEYIKTHYFDKIDRNLDELEDEYKRTGDISLLDKREEIVNDAISQADSKLSELYANGYTEDNDDVQFWLDRQEKYNDELKSILDERNDIINTNLKERRESYDEVYAKTGDNSVFKQEIKDIEDAQKAKIALIEEYKKLGYTDESDTIKGLHDEIKDLGDDILDVNQEYADSIVKLAEKSAESIEKTIEKTGDTNKYNDIVAVYKKARDEIGKLIADEYAKGADANQSYIQKLQEQYDSLSDEIKSTFDSITKSITDSVDEQIENIDRKIKQTGDYSLISDKIGVYNKGKTDITKQIATLLLEGYSVNSEEVKELYNQLKSYDDDILDVYSEIADRIDTETQEQIDVIDREIKKTGDTKQYQIKINVLADSKKSLEDLRDELIKSGVDANSEIIKDLDKRIQSIDDDIAETSKDRIDAQVEVYEDVMSLETEQLEKYKKEQDDIFDAKIKALEDQKKVLEEQNDEIEKQNELQEKQKNILDAQRNVMKSVRMVYSGNGTWSVKATDESLEKLQEAEKELENTKRKQQIEAIDKLIDGVEEQKKTFDDAIDKQTTAIEEGVKAFKDTMEKSYKVYGQLDYVLLKSILGEDAAQEYYDTFNTAYEKNVDQSNVATTTQDSLVESVKNQIKANNELTKTTEKETKAVDEFGDEMQKEFGVGNVDLTKRPFVSGEKMRQAGYDVDENGVSTVYTSTHFVWQGDEEHGKYVAVHVTPILPNGEVLSEQELEDYIYNQLEGNDDILKADSKGIVLKVDTDLNLTEEDIQSLNNGKPTKHMQNALDIIDKWDIALHEAQEQWMNLWFDEYGKPDFSNNKSIDLMGDKIYNGILGVVQKILKGTLSIGGILPVSQNALSQMNGYSNADNIQNNYNNFSPNVNTTVNITTTSGDVNDMKNALIDVVDNRIVAGLQAFYDGYNQSAMRTMFGH